MEELEIIFGHPSDDRSWRTLLNFYECLTSTSAPATGLSRSSKHIEANVKMIIPITSIIVDVLNATRYSGLF
jgi:hypothetical protein